MHSQENTRTRKEIEYGRKGYYREMWLKSFNHSYVDSVTLMGQILHGKRYKEMTVVEGGGGDNTSDKVNAVIWVFDSAFK